MFIRKLHYLHQLTRSQWKPKRELERLQLTRLRQLVSYVYDNNEFYHELYRKQGVKPQYIKTIADIEKLPVVTKAMLRDFSPSKNVDKVVSRNTSGSSGAPFSVLFDDKSWDYSEANYARSLFGTGYNPLDKLFFSYAYDIPGKRWFNRLFLIRKRYLPFAMPIDEQIGLLENEKSRFTLYSFPSVLHIMNQLKFHPQNMSRIISTGELLSDNLRTKLEKRLGCPVYNHYGTMEVNRVAWECQMKDGFHIDIDSHVVEFVRDNEEVATGERGKIHVTNLMNPYFPLIRYNQGDYAVPTDRMCRCGRGLPLAKEIVGRDNDFIVTEDNKLLSPIQFDVLLSRIPNVVQYRMVQKTLKSIELQLVTTDEYRESDSHPAIKDIKDILGKDCTMNAKYVSRIKRSKGGKLQAVYSNVRKA